MAIHVIGRSANALILGLEKRVEILEHKVEILAQLPDRVSSLESQVLQLRTEMRDGFSAIQSEFTGLTRAMTAGDEETRRELRSEIQAGDEETRRELRAEIRAGDEETRRDKQAQDGHARQAAAEST